MFQYRLRAVSFQPRYACLAWRGLCPSNIVSIFVL